MNSDSFDSDPEKILCRYETASFQPHTIIISVTNIHLITEELAGGKKVTILSRTGYWTIQMISKQFYQVEIVAKCLFKMLW